MQTSEKQSMVDDRLVPFIGNDPVCDSEHGGMIHQARNFSGVDFLMPSSQLQESLEEYSAQIQEAVNLHANH